MPRPTIRSIADKLSLSTATISLALRGHPRIPEVTRERVQAAAREVGYHPNPSIAQLMTHIRSARHVDNMMTIGLLNFSDFKDFQKASYYHQQLWNGIRVQAEKLGYRVEPFWIKAKGMTQKRVNSILESRGIQGLVIPPMGSSGTTLDLNWERFSAVTVGYGLLEPRLNRIVGNQRQAMFSCLKYLLNTGHKRISAVWHESFDTRMTFISSSVFTWYQEQIPKARRIPMLHLENYSANTLQQWIGMNRPDAIITHIPGLVDIIRNAKFRVPDDISVVIEGSKTQDSSITGSFVAAYDIGRRLIKMLDSQLLQYELGIPALPVTVLMDKQWHHGKTMANRGKPEPLVRTFEQIAW